MLLINWDKLRFFRLLAVGFDVLNRWTFCLTRFF